MTNGIERLLIMKQDITQVTRQMTHEQKNLVQENNEMDNLGETMKYIRAVEAGRWGAAKAARKRCPELEGKLKKKEDDKLSEEDIKMLQGWATQLAWQSIQEEINELKKNQENMEENDVQRKKENIIRKLKKMNGDTSSGIKAVKDEHGRIHTEVSDITEVLEKHWASVFQQKGHDKKLL